MKASEVIEEIQSLIDKHGDLPCALADLDTQWILPIEVMFSEENKDQDGRDMILITSSYP